MERTGNSLVSRPRGASQPVSLKYHLFLCYKFKYCCIHLLSTYHTCSTVSTRPRVRIQQHSPRPDTKKSSTNHTPSHHIQGGVTEGMSRISYKFKPVFRNSEAVPDIEPKLLSRHLNEGGKKVRLTCKTRMSYMIHC